MQYVCEFVTPLNDIRKRRQTTTNPCLGEKLRDVNDCATPTNRIMGTNVCSDEITPHEFPFHLIDRFKESLNKNRFWAAFDLFNRKIALYKKER